jgi:hypothetical protein
MLRQPATSTFSLQQLPSAVASEAAATAVTSPVAPAKASPAAGLELQPLLAHSNNSSSPLQQLLPARAGSDWLSDDDDSEVSVQLLPPAVPLAASLVTTQPADSREFDIPAAAADSLQHVHAPAPAALAAVPGAGYGGAAASAAAVTESSAGADSFAVVASESAVMLCMTDSSPAAQDALQVAAPMEVSM